MLEYTSTVLCLPAAGSPRREMDPPYKEHSVGGESDVPPDKSPELLVEQAALFPQTLHPSYTGITERLEKYICLKLPAIFFFFFLVLAFVLFVLFEGGNSVLRRDEA